MQLLRLFVRPVHWVLLLCLMPAIASRAAEPYPDGWSGPALYELIFATRSLDRKQRAAQFIEWMRANDWKAIDFAINDLYNLFEIISIDSIEPSSFSVEWTGLLTPSKAGEYRFRQVQDFSGRSSRLTVAINGEEILDTASADDSDEYLSRTVRLTADKAVPIRVTLVHEVPPPMSVFGGGWPMALVTWKVGGGPESLIPSSALRPDNDSEKTSHGLQAKYYSDTNFSRLATTRVDASLDMVWTSSPIAPVYAEADECLRMCKELLLDGDLLNKAADDSKLSFVLDYNLWRVAYRMTATERQKLLQMLLANPKLMSAMSLGAVARLSQAFYMLPGDDYVCFVGEWSILHPQPKSLAGEFPGWSEGSYQQQNTDYYWLIGLFMQGPYWDQTETLWRDYLELPNGDCNLPVAYATAYSTREEAFQRSHRHIHTFPDQLEQRLSKKDLSGDSRASWLLAKAFFQEITTGEPVNLNPDQESLQEAMLVVESESYRNWMIQEIAVRRAALGQVERLDEMLADFNSADERQQAVMQLCKSVAAAQKQRREEWLAAERSSMSSEVAEELAARIQRAESKEADGIAKNYRQLLNSTQTNAEK